MRAAFDSWQPCRRLAVLIFLAICSVGEAASFVRVENEGGAWSFENESGRFLSFGINGVRMNEYWAGDARSELRKKQGYYDVRGKYVKPYHDWVADVRHRMDEWGFNTAGAWSSALLQQSGILYCHLLPIGWTGRPNRLVDLFEPAFETYADKVAARECTGRADDPNLMGYFLDNELPWYGDKSWQVGRDSLLQVYSRLPGDAPGRAALLAFLQDRFPQWESFRAEFATDAGSWGALARRGEVTATSPAGREVEAGWAGKVAERFYTVSVAAIRRYDAHHLLLGSRFAGNAPPDVWRAAAVHCDVLSVNYYPAPDQPALKRWREMFALTNKPLLLSETSLRAAENGSKNRNSVGSGGKVATQEERAAAMSGLLDAWLGEPYVVGIHWFEYADQPPGGRGHNGENSNYGLVDINDQPYPDLVAAWHRAVQTRRGHNDPTAPRQGPP